VHNARENQHGKSVLWIAFWWCFPVVVGGAFLK